MLKITSNQETLVKARKASGAITGILIFGGAVLFLIGISTAFLPQVLNGAVMLAASVPCYAFRMLIQRKLSLPPA